MSVISSTDVECFRRLSNPEVIDLHGHASSSRQIAQQMREAMEKAVAESSSAKKQEDDGSDEDPEEQKVRTPTAETAPPPSTSSSSSSPAPSRLSSAISALASASGPSAATPSTLPVRDRPAGPTPSLTAIPEEESRSEEEEPAAAAAPTPPRRAPTIASGGDAEGTRLEKQGVLLELHALQAKGVRLTREFTMEDSLNELEFELQKQTSMLNTISAVQNMKDVLRLGLNGLELANSKLGPFICMEGWAESLTADMKRFDAPLEKLYKRYWRKASMSPLMELAMIILGSLAMHHFKTKIFGRVAPGSFSGPRDDAAQPAYRHPAAPPPPSGPALRGATVAGTPAQGSASQAPPLQMGGRLRRGLGGTPPPPAQPADARVRRPVLRSPSSLLGL